MTKVIGMDLGDKRHVVVVFDETGDEVEVAKITNTSRQVQRYFEGHPGAVVVMEAGTHSAWITRLLESMDHEVHVGNPRKLRAIWDTDDKSDERDARVLGLMYRLEPRLLHPVFHRSERAQADLELIKAREQLVGCRSKLINHVRGVVKSMGERIPKCSTQSFHRRAVEHMPSALAEALGSVVAMIEKLTEQIDDQDKLIKAISPCWGSHPSVINPAIPTNNSALPRRVTVTCGACWSTALTTSWGRWLRTAIYVVMGSVLPHGEAKTPRNGPWWPWPGSSRYSSTVYGWTSPSTFPCDRRGRRQHEHAGTEVTHSRHLPEPGEGSRPRLWITSLRMEEPENRTEIEGD